MSSLTSATQTAITPQGDLISLWHAYLIKSVAQGDISQTTSSTYRTGLAKFMAWAQTAGIVSVMPKDVGDFKAAMLANAKASSVNVWLSGVRAFYAWAVESGHMLMNPAAQIKGAKRKGANKTHKRDALTQAEAGRELGSRIK